MKIGLITLHDSYSYGACLQTYATYYILKKMDNEVIIINYINKYEHVQNKLLPISKYKSIKSSIISSIENIFLLRYFNLKKSYKRFHMQYNKTHIYYNKDEMEKLEFDCMISGSDQLWNPEIFEGLDSAFFLDFGICKKRISYAASCGSYLYNEEEIEKIKGYLSNYNAISVREKFLYNQINNLLDKNVEIVVDPTLLISRDEWLKIANKQKKHVENRKYILLYLVGIRYSDYLKKYLKVVEYYKKELGYKVYAINHFSFKKIKGTDKSLNDLDPFDFINYINNAELIITSSFHGLAFSINLNKKFVALKTSNPYRITDLLGAVNLESRLIDNFSLKDLENTLKDIDYDTVNKKLEKISKESYNWLVRSLND